MLEVNKKGLYILPDYADLPLLRDGQYHGTCRVGCIRAGVVDVNWVYNPMPPVPGQIYPRQPLVTVTDFTYGQVCKVSREM